MRTEILVYDSDEAKNIVVAFKKYFGAIITITTPKWNGSGWNIVIVHDKQRRETIVAFCHGWISAYKAQEKTIQKVRSIILEQRAKGVF